MVIFVDLEKNTGSEEGEAMDKLSGVNLHSFIRSPGDGDLNNDGNAARTRLLRSAADGRGTASRHGLTRRLDDAVDDDGEDDEHADDAADAAKKDEHEHEHEQAQAPAPAPAHDADKTRADEESDSADGGFSEANYSIGIVKMMDCYPIMTSVARAVDISTLDALSSSCKQMYTGLIPCHKVLSAKTLRCVNDSRPNSSASERPSEARQSWASLNGPHAKSSPCVKDMVKGCMSCGTVICRNCIAKPLSRPRTRCRRLCPKCIAQPISKYVAEASPPRSKETTKCPQALSILIDDMFCKCQDDSWFCSKCRHDKFRDDTLHSIEWAQHLQSASTDADTDADTDGGGDKATTIICARGLKCFANMQEDEEISARDERHGASDDDNNKNDDDNDNDNNNNDNDNDNDKDENDRRSRSPCPPAKPRAPGTVELYIDERETETFLQPEETGQQRAWCNWCDRLIASKEDCAAVAEGRF